MNHRDKTKEELIKESEELLTEDKVFRTLSS